MPQESHAEIKAQFIKVHQGEPRALCERLSARSSSIDLEKLILLFSPPAMLMPAHYAAGV
jgi:hypothetical protein